MDTYQSRSMYARNRMGHQVGCCPSDLGVRGSNHRWCVCVFLCGNPFFCSSIKICTMIEVSSEQSRSQCYMHAYCNAAAASAAALVSLYCCCCCSSSAGASCCFLPLFVTMCRMVKVVAGSLNLISVFFSSFKRGLFVMVPLGSTADCVAFTASICLHPR